MAKTSSASHPKPLPPQLSTPLISASIASPIEPLSAGTSLITTRNRSRNLATPSTNPVDTRLSPPTHTSSTSGSSSRTRSTRCTNPDGTPSSNTSIHPSLRRSSTMSLTTFPFETPASPLLSPISPPYTPIMLSFPESSLYSFPFTPPASPSLASEFDLSSEPSRPSTPLALPTPPPPPPTVTRSPSQLARLGSLFSIWRRS